MPLETASIKTLSCGIDGIAVDNTYQTWFGAFLHSLRRKMKLAAVPKCEATIKGTRIDFLYGVG
jgi:hypothetical protein